MAVRFGVFVPQGWRMDLAEVADPVEQYAETLCHKIAVLREHCERVELLSRLTGLPTPCVGRTARP